MKWSFILVALVLIGCQESPKVEPSTTKGPPIGTDKPSQISYNTSMNFSSGGMLRAILHAGRIQQFDVKRYTWLDSGVKVDFYNRDGKHSSIMTSESARVDGNTNDMTAYGRVHIVSDSGTTVDTDSLHWSNKEQTLRSEAHVHIVEKSGRVTDGLGFESDQNLEHYHILHPIIVAPAGSMQTRGGSGQPSLRPETPAVPGAGAVSAPPISRPLQLDTSKK